MLICVHMRCIRRKYSQPSSGDGQNVLWGGCGHGQDMFDVADGNAAVRPCANCDEAGRGNLKSTTCPSRSRPVRVGMGAQHCANVRTRTGSQTVPISIEPHDQ